MAQRAAPDSRVVLVDIDPVAVAHSRHILKDNDRTAVVHADVRRPERILEAPELRQLFNPQEPVAVLAVALFHFIPDQDDPTGIISRLTGPLVPGSYLALSHVTGDGPDDWTASRDIYRPTRVDGALRSRAQVQALFSGFDLGEPGVVWAPLWHPESPDDPYYEHPERSSVYVGVGRKAN